MLQRILTELKRSSTVSVRDLADKLGADRQSVMAALEQLQRMGYIINLAKQQSCNGKSCAECSGCGNDFNKIVGAMYTLRQLECDRTRKRE